MVSGKKILSETFGFSAAYTIGVLSSTYLRSATPLLFDPGPLAYCTAFAGAVALGSGVLIAGKSMCGNYPAMGGIFEGGLYGGLYGGICGVLAADHLP